MFFSTDRALSPRTLLPRRFRYFARAALIAVIATFAAAGPVAGEGSALPAGTFTEQPWSFSAVEGQSFSGVVAAFKDSDPVTPANFTSVQIDWGDGSAISAGTALRSGIDTHLFYISGAHTFSEESGFALAVSLHDTHDLITRTISSSNAVVADAPLCVCLAVTPGVPQSFSGSGGSNAGGGAHSAQQAFQAAIGGADNGSNPTPQPNGFRTLNWDAVRLDGTDFGGNSFVIDAGKTVGLPVNRFQERGTLFNRVYAVSRDGFSDVNLSVGGVLTAFTLLNDFAPFNTHTVDLSFVLPSLHTTTAMAAGTRGFGGIFINVHNPAQSSIEYFAGPLSLGKFYVPLGSPSNPAYSFLGELFTQPIVTRVQLTLGNGTIFRFDGATFAAGASDNQPDGTNVVALDDLAFAEPQPVTPAATVSLTPTVNVPFTSTVGSFIDIDPNGQALDFSALIDWGDGHTSPGLISPSGGGAFFVRGSNTYATGGSFPITFTVQDFGGARVNGLAEARVPPLLFMPVVTK